MEVVKGLPVRSREHNRFDPKITMVPMKSDATYTKEEVLVLFAATKEVAGGVPSKHPKEE